MLRLKTDPHPYPCPPSSANHTPSYTSSPSSTLSIKVLVSILFGWKLKVGGDKLSFETTHFYCINFSMVPHHHQLPHIMHNVKRDNYITSPIRSTLGWSYCDMIGGSITSQHCVVFTLEKSNQFSKALEEPSQEFVGQWLQIRENIMSSSIVSTNFFWSLWYIYFKTFMLIFFQVAHTHNEIDIIW